ncbi:hypothetical protein CgunFtcFv8_021951 [Champsocephalus gunnari]|uniref:Uncharacterized protein n=1 Tax=Champsocephalus gunnari TaxID=52237 RepID=A0AAN8DNZ7_CHAGU|nr:hypothetical protein CgunFtcFv8_021951 [Champsocephalus gunnari]
MDALMQYIYCLSVCHPSLTPLQACCSLLQREELRDVSEGWSGSLVEAEKNGEKIARTSGRRTLTDELRTQVECCHYVWSCD